MKISQKQILKNGEEKLMCLPEDSLVSRLVLQEEEKERKITATSGRSLNVLYGKSNHVGLLVKMLLGSSQWYSPSKRLTWKYRNLNSRRLVRQVCMSKNSLLKQSAAILKVKDIPSNRLLYQLVPSVRPIEETVFGSLPIGTVPDFKKCRLNDEKQKQLKTNYQMLPTPQAADSSIGAVIGRNDHFVLTRNGTLRKVNQNGQSGSVGLARMVNLMCTPTATDWKGGSQRRQKKFQYSSLRNEVHADYGTGKTSQLNPLFVEEMMGFPTGWILRPFLKESAIPKEAQHIIDGEPRL